MVQTVCGKVRPEELGHFQIHEHIWVHHTPLADKNPALRIDDYEKSLAELKTYRNAGGCGFADAQPVAAGRNAEMLKKLSEESGVHMKAIQYAAARNWSLVEVPTPEPGPHQVLIRVKACGICKTDLSLHVGSFLAKFPLINGHEFAGVVEKVGSAVKDFKPGDRVTADNTELCGHCDACRADKPLYCENFDSHGCNMDGGFAEYVLINHDKVFPIHNLTFEQATFAEPTACAVHGVDRIAPKFGDTIVMFGAGPTGIILAQLLRRAGAGRMIICDPNAHKLEILKKYGFEETIVMDRNDPSKHTAILKELMPKGFDICIDATGAPSVFGALFNFAHKGSKIVAYGCCPADATVPVNPYDIFAEEYTILGSFAQTHCFDRALYYLESGIVQVQELISHELPLEGYGDGLQLILDKKAHKVIIKP